MFTERLHVALHGACRLVRILGCSIYQLFQILLVLFHLFLISCGIWPSDCVVLFNLVFPHLIVFFLFFSGVLYV